ncbi:helix-turn-helix domain-containing protein [Enterococcus faecalis]|uniref:helix-turn-helix domain-containing protein n=1 Tax=Enterococcus faecalis TaxID=1351 RepID=UPI00288D1636|nr:helix-turn-helix domain-containing protein [Enterococcus faecalis]MDT2164518.1 helix-turn-helix domain-containing protein [Enterococcus faecalis]
MIPDYLTKEFRVLFFIISKNKTSINEISRTLRLSKRSVKEELLTINNHFEEFLKIKNFIQSDKTGVIQVHLNFKNTALENASNLKLLLLKNCVTFNYTMLLITRTSLTRNNILKELFISPSYLNKLTKQLNTFFSPFGFRINYMDEKHCLIGNEINIRLFSFLFLQDSFQDIEWPFSELPIENIRIKVLKKGLYGPSNIQKRALCTLYAIWQMRMKQHQYVTHPKSQFIHSILVLIKENLDITKIFRNDNYHYLDYDIKELETQYFNFFSHILISDIIPNTKKIGLGKIFEKKGSFFSNVRNIFAESSSIFNNPISNSDKYTYLYYIILLCTLNFLSEGAIYNFTNLINSQLPSHLKIDNAYMNVNKHKYTFLITDNSYLQLLSSFLYNLYSSQIKTEVKIYLQMSKDFTASFIIENKLSNLYNNNEIIITDNYSLADIVVTDSLDRNSLNKNIFYFDSISNEERWKELLFFIQQIYLEKQSIYKEQIYL